MKSNQIRVLFSGLAISLMLGAQIPSWSLTNNKSSNSKTITSHKDKTREKTLSAKNKEIKAKTDLAETTTDEILVGPEQNKLTQAAAAYTANPDDTTYNPLWDNFVSFAEVMVAKHKDPVHLFKSWKALSQAGLKIIEPIGSSSHIYSFNHIATNTASFMPQTKSVLIQWNDSIAETPAASTAVTRKGKQKKSKLKKIKAVAAIKTQTMSVPSYIDVKEAVFLPHPVAIEKTSVVKWVKGKKIVKVVKPAKAHITVASGHYLILLGTDVQSGHTCLVSLKQNNTGWINYTEALQDVPMYLLQSNGAKLRFSGNTLVITIAGSSGYELIMPWIGDRFAFSTREAQDSASAVAHQFLLALQYKRPDLAKIWLSDPKLVSIPGYLALFAPGTDTTALRLAIMPCPLSGGSRFRLITGGRNDLIIDVAKIKTQQLIKALFIAPVLNRSTLINPSTEAPKDKQN